MVFILLITFGDSKWLFTSLFLVLIDFIILKTKNKKISALFYLSSGIVVFFGLADLYLQEPFFYKFEAFLTNFIFAVFFGLSLFKEKPIVQEFAEMQNSTWQKDAVYIISPHQPKVTRRYMYTTLYNYFKNLSLRGKLLCVVLPLVIIPILLVGSVTGYIANHQAYLGITQTSKADLEHMTSFTLDLLNAHYQQFQAIVEHGRVGTVGIDNRQGLLDVVAEQVTFQQ